MNERRVYPRAAGDTLRDTLDREVAGADDFEPDDAGAKIRSDQGKALADAAHRLWVAADLGKAVWLSPVADDMARKAIATLQGN